MSFLNNSRCLVRVLASVLGGNTQIETNDIYRMV